MGGLPRAGLALGARPLPGDPLTGDLIVGITATLGAVMLLITNDRMAFGLFRGDPGRIERPLLPAIWRALKERSQESLSSESFRMGTIKLWLFALALAVGYIGVSRILEAV